jgi:Ca2+/H+ antiporter, TMEM165/GDT1 family
MDALLTALIGCLFAEVGGASQLLVLALAARFQRPAAIIAGIAVAAAANAAISAAAGAFIGPMLGSNARLLFLALAVLFLGLGMLWPVKTPDPLANWTIGPFLTSAIGLFILGFGDGAQFLILGIAIRTASPELAALGGAVGVIAALIPAALLGEPLFRALPWRPVRRAGGVLMLILSLILAVNALCLA